jgi:hypothetical protein
MRRLIVKHFALNYTFKVFNTNITSLRASRIIAPLFLITGILVSAFTPEWPTPTLLLWIFYFLDIIALFFGFIYFRFRPIKWEELDKDQKYQYGVYVKLTGDQYLEWVQICKDLVDSNI